ncbi:nicotinate (nicotinamide) nucleotide adenylyltransferase [Novipirellula artificiosorum]|uniref:Probable nicotinate-nucleotide adenylyltransferase n=1 Tax=Novipirellula artificiosorum TaxID=2528016 RepID=A0A5C6E584_9BACT|nr:nicotinate (nicotinamide) nucleotide adenylyltransferase [Novipirellula artificiosorum]TWU42319.1 Nicotinate-nucleotide adenylyltransferase [Novipirellula artificiosorum]
MRIGLFGGSFDPVHLGHLWIAESAIESLGLDQVRWIPAALSPLKPNGPVASDQDRLEMLRLAISGSEKHVIDDREVRRGDVSYTVDTVVQLQSEFPIDDFYLIIGSDSLATIRQWYQSRKLLEKILLAVVQRGGEEQLDFSVLDRVATPQRIEEIGRHTIKMPVIEISSREIRERVAQGRSIRYRVPRSVEALIDAKNLYVPQS